MCNHQPCRPTSIVMACVPTPHPCGLRHAKQDAQPSFLPCHVDISCLGLFLLDTTNIASTPRARLLVTIAHLNNPATCPLMPRCVSSVSVVGCVCITSICAAAGVPRRSVHPALAARLARPPNALAPPAAAEHHARQPRDPSARVAGGRKTRPPAAAAPALCTLSTHATPPSTTYKQRIGPTSARAAAPGALGAPRLV